jgi:peptide/nickel transport system permease protein
MTAGATAAARPAKTTRARLPRKVWIGAFLVGFVVVLGVLAPWIARYDPIAQDIVHRLAPPSAQHWFGTDALGRDYFSRVAYAARLDVPVAVAAAFLSMVLGSILGALAGFFGRLTDTALMRLADLVQAFPVYILLVALAFALGSGVRSILIAYTAIGWVVYARLLRGEVMRARDMEYIQAAHISGVPRLRILRRHIAPNVVSQPLIYLMSDIVMAMGAFVSLSYFGLGVTPPTPEWGLMIADAQPYMASQWWLAVTPGVMIVTVGAGFSLLGDGFEELLKR